MAKIKIRMTGRRSIIVDSETWPVLVSVDDNWHDGKVRCQAGREENAEIEVRTNASGTAIVSGTYSYDSSHEGARGVSAHAGFKVPDCGGEPDFEMIAVRIESVGCALKNAAHENGEIDIDALVREAIAALPAEEI